MIIITTLNKYWSVLNVIYFKLVFYAWVNEAVPFTFLGTKFTKC